MAADPDTHDAIKALHAKQAKRARWSKIAGILVTVALLIRLGAALLTPAAAQECDATEVKSVLTDLVNQSLKKSGSAITLTTIDNIKTVVDDKKLRRCSGHIAMSDKSEGTLTYHVDPKQVQVDDVK